MAILSVLEYPHPILMKPTTTVAAVDEVVKTLVANMIETMYADKGCGLAANQVGVSQRILVLDATREGYQPQVFINPTILSSSEELIEMDEGCLSFPGLYIPVARPIAIELTYWDLEGVEHRISADGVLARILQHEIDHLDGVIFVARLASRLKRDRALQKYKKGCNL